MKVVIGLRNPGPDYAGTRHNVGWEAVTAVAARHAGRIKRGPLRVRAELAQVRIGDDTVVLAGPLSFMNECGGPVRSVLAYHKAGVEDLLVVHDDIDLGFGRLRIQNGGGTGGHNGLRSIEKALGTREFARLKIGVGRPRSGSEAADHVLSRFSKAERVEVDHLVEDAAEVIGSWVTDPVRAQEQAAHRSIG